MKNIALLLSVVIVFLSCKGTQPIEHVYSGNALPVNIGSASEIDITQVIDTVAYIKLESSEDCYLGTITDVISFDDKLIIADKMITKSVYLFENNGKLIRAIGKVGQGPGEYSDVSHVMLSTNGQNIIIMDILKNQFIYYSLNGDYLKSEPLQYRAGNIGYINENALAYYNLSGVFSGSNDMENTLLVSNKNGSLLYSTFPRLNNKEFNVITNANCLRMFGNTLYLNPNLSDIIYQVTSTQCNAVYNIIGAERPVLNDKTKNEEYIHFLDEKTVFNGDFVITDDYLIFGLFPNGTLPMFYNKKTNELYKLPKQKRTDELRLFKEGPAMFLHDNQLIIQIDPNEILEDYAENKEVYDGNEFLNQLVKGIKQDDNYILFFYKLKTL